MGFVEVWFLGAVLVQKVHFEPDFLAFISDVTDLAFIMSKSPSASRFSNIRLQ